MPLVFASQPFHPNVIPIVTTTDPLKQQGPMLSDNGYNGGFQPIIVLQAGANQNMNQATMHFNVIEYY